MAPENEAGNDADVLRRSVRTGGVREMEIAPLASSRLALRVGRIAKVVERILTIL